MNPGAVIAYNPSGSSPAVCAPRGRPRASKKNTTYTAYMFEVLDNPAAPPQVWENLTGSEWERLGTVLGLHGGEVFCTIWTRSGWVFCSANSLEPVNQSFEAWSQDRTRLPGRVIFLHFDTS